MHTESRLDTQSNLISKHDKSSLNTSHIQQINNSSPNNRFDDTNDPLNEQNNELQIKKYLKQTIHMMKLFNKPSKSQGCIEIYYIMIYIIL